jgi:excisionase family DNA binding protein
VTIAGLEVSDEYRGCSISYNEQAGSEMTGTHSEAMLSAAPTQDRAGAAEYLLELMTVDEIAAALRVSPSWVYERVRKRGKDKMPHLKIGKYLRFRLNEVRTWIDRGEAR